MATTISRNSTQSLQDLNGDQIDALYAQAGHLVLELPAQCEFGIDGQLWTVQTMSGVKFLPPGLHLFVLGSPASATSLTSTRHAFFHFVQPQTTLIRQWDVEEEKLLPSEDLSTSRTAVNSSSTGDVISQDHLRSLDAHLAPYPYDRRRKWEALSSCIDAACLARVLGFKSNGDALVDGLQLLTSEAPKPVKQQWGKPRREEEEQHKAAEPQPAAPETLGFAQFDLKRSWPPQAVGEDLTKHSRDKQWLREQVIAQVGGPRQLLAELQLAFLLFTQVTNFSALDVYRNTLSLLCRSSASPNDLDTYVSLLAILHAQLSFLRPEFFVEDLPELEHFLNEAFEALRVHLKPLASMSDEVVRAWVDVEVLTRDKFGWALNTVAGYPKVQPGRTHYNLLASQNPAGNQMVDDEDLLAEEGEDAPVVVEL